MVFWAMLLDSLGYGLEPPKAGTAQGGGTPSTSRRACTPPLLDTHGYLRYPGQIHTLCLCGVVNAHGYAMPGRYMYTMCLWRGLRWPVVFDTTDEPLPLPSAPTQRNVGPLRYARRCSARRRVEQQPHRRLMQTVSSHALDGDTSQLT
jgi:hypothetical protein